MISIECCDVNIPITTWKFPAGEVGFKINDIEQVTCSLSNDFDIEVEFESNDDIFLALQAIDAMKNLGVEANKIYVRFKYLPYSRQDRYCQPGESFALKIFTDIMNQTGVNIYTFDVHSNVAIDLCEKMWNTPQYVFSPLHYRAFDFIVAPDKGALLKIELHKDVRWLTEIVCLNKQRVDRKVIYEDYEQDKLHGTVCVIDDICDGGATFISLAEMLIKTQPRIESLNLYVTHGIFSNEKSFDKLSEMYDNIFVANLMNKQPEIVKRVLQLKEYQQ